MTGRITLPKLVVASEGGYLTIHNYFRVDFYAKIINTLSRTSTKESE
jgi:hypothetical protein